MTPIEVYAVVVVGIMLAAIGIRLSHGCVYGLSWLESCLDRYLTHTVFGSRLRWLRPWPCSVVLVQVIVVAVNLLLICYRSSDRQSTGQRAGAVAIVNMGLFYLAPSLAHLADWFDVSWSMMKWIHGGGTLSSAILISTHAIIARPSKPLFSFPFSEQFYGVLAALLLAILLTACILPVRRVCYEVFLRTHQLLATGIWVAIWLHVRDSQSLVARYGVMVSTVCFALGGLEPIVHVLVLNRFFTSGMPRAQLSLVGHVVRVVVITPTTFDIHAGQYVHVWMPRVSWSSHLQTHPFVVTSVRRLGQGLKMELMVEPHRGWTFKLEQRAREEDTAHQAHSYRTLVSRPHGPRIPVDDYGVVVLAASGWGLMAQIPFLQQLTRGFHGGTTRARRVHLIWQLGHEGTGRPAKALLDQALLEDRANQGNILQISIYYRDGDLSEKDRRPGRRVAFREGFANWESLILDDLGQGGLGPRPDSDQLETGPPTTTTSDLAFSSGNRRTVVLVSTTSQIRDRIRRTCRSQLSPLLHLVDLDYQPSDRHRQ